MKSIYMDERWVRLQSEKEGGGAVYYKHFCDAGEIIYPFIKREAGIVNGVKYYDIVTPRGECGPRIENVAPSKASSLISSFDIAFQRYCEEERIVAEYIRFSSWGENIDGFPQIYDVKFREWIFCNDLTWNFFKEELVPVWPSPVGARLPDISLRRLIGCF